MSSVMKTQKEKKRVLARSLAVILGLVWVSQIAGSVGGQTYPRSVGVCGDSISRGFNSGRLRLRSALAVNWATGSRSCDTVSSHLERIARLSGNAGIRGYNSARLGAKSEDFVRQARGMVQARPDYVLVFFGANDLCASNFAEVTPVETFEANMKLGLTVLARGLPSSRILVVPIIDLVRVVDTGVRQGCWRKRVLRRICRVLPPSADARTRTRFGALVYEYNEALRRAASSLGENVRFAQGVEDYFLKPGYLSDFDCFHPSEAGQAFLAEITWRHGFWPSQ